MNDIENEVQIDLNVVFSMLQHLNDTPVRDITATAGALVGLKQETLLSVTNAFPFPRTNLQHYHHDVCRVLEKLDCETHVVGLYTAAALDSFMSEDFLTKLYLYQYSIAECVVLVFDYVKVSLGIPSIKAYKLTQKALDLLQSKDYSSSNILGKLGSFENLLCEIPITIRLSPLTRVVVEKMRLLPMIEPKPTIENEYDLLDKRIYYLNRSLKDLSQEVYKICAKCKKIQSNFISDQSKDKIDSTDPIPTQAGESLDYLGMIISCWNTKFLNDEVSNFVNFIKSQPEILDLSQAK